MKIKYFLLPLLVLMSCTSKSKYTDVAFEEITPRDWENPEIFGINKEEPRSYFIPYDNDEDVLTDNKKGSPFYRSLNGKWKFRLENTPYVFPMDFYEKNFDDSKWNEIKVPAVWQMQGYDHLIY